MHRSWDHVTKQPLQHWLQIPLRVFHTRRAAVLGRHSLQRRRTSVASHWKQLHSRRKHTGLNPTEVSKKRRWWFWHRKKRDRKRGQCQRRIAGLESTGTRWYSFVHAAGPDNYG